MWIRRLKFLLFTLLASLLAGLVAYTATRYLTHNTSITGHIDRETLDRARALRSLSNELVDLAQKFASEMPKGPAAPTPGERRWLEEELYPQVLDLDRRLQILGRDDAPIRALRQASQRMLNLMLHPPDAALREQALQEVKRAAARVEEQIEKWRATRYLGEPIRKPRW